MKSLALKALTGIALVQHGAVKSMGPVAEVSYAPPDASVPGDLIVVVGGWTPTEVAPNAPVDTAGTRARW